MFRSAIAAILMVAAMAGPAAATPPALTVARFLEICGSSTMTEAAGEGGALGWERMDAQKFQEWRAAFLRYNGESTEVIGWQRGKADDDDSLFWIVTGPDGHRICSTLLADPTGMLSGLTEHFGRPDSLDQSEAITSAYWKKDAAEISFSQVGSSTEITLLLKD